MGQLNEADMMGACGGGGDIRFGTVDGLNCRSKLSGIGFGTLHRMTRTSCRSDA